MSYPSTAFAVVTAISLLVGSADAALITVLGFETSGDTWGFTPVPSRYNPEGDEIIGGNLPVWTEIQQFTGDIDAPAEGSRFWGMKDLDNEVGGGPFDHVLTFDDIDVSAFADVELSFAYNAREFQNNEYLRYEALYDGVGQGEVAVVTGANQMGGVSTTGWETELIAVPDTVDTLGLRLIGRQTGGGTNRVSGWDSVGLSGAAIPEPSSLVLFGMFALGGICRQIRRLRRADAAS